jgi:hypothetical protein
MVCVLVIAVLVLSGRCLWGGAGMRRSARRCGWRRRWRSGHGRRWYPLLSLLHIAAVVPVGGHVAASRCWRSCPAPGARVGAQGLEGTAGCSPGRGGTVPSIGPRRRRYRTGYPAAPAAEGRWPGLRGAGSPQGPGRGRSHPASGREPAGKPLISLDPRGGPPSGDHLMRSAARR